MLKSITLLLIIALLTGCTVQSTTSTSEYINPDASTEAGASDLLSAEAPNETGIQGIAVGSHGSVKGDETQAKYRCDCSKVCMQIATCSEAKFQYQTCGCKSVDPNNNGIACDGSCK